MVVANALTTNAIREISQLIFFPQQLRAEGLDLTIEQLIRDVPRTFADAK